MKLWRTPSREEASALGALISLPAQILITVALMRPATTMPTPVLLGAVTFAFVFAMTTSHTSRHKIDIAVRYLRTRHGAAAASMHPGAVVRIIAAAVIGNLAAAFVVMGMVSLLLTIVLR
jgi:hypothetical protein